MRLFLTLLIACCALAAMAQIPGLGGRGPKIDLGMDNLFKKGPAITTNLKDAKWEDASKDSLELTYSPLSELERTARGGFILKAGAYGADMQSYCLHAGTHGPGGGDAYLYAPPLGPYEKVVQILVENSYAKPQVPQRRIQLLLWAMMARTKFSDLSRELQATAAELLTPKQIADLNGGAIAFIADELMAKGIIKEPPLVQQVMQAENKLRQAFSNPASSFEQFEAIAVLTGQIGLGPGSRETPRGRWSAHPDGFWVRYMPSGYSRTTLQIYIPEGSKAIGKEFNPASHIATPTNTYRQRLLQSGRFYQN